MCVWECVLCGVLCVCAFACANMCLCVHNVVACICIFVIANDAL